MKFHFIICIALILTSCASVQNNKTLEAFYNKPPTVTFADTSINLRFGSQGRLYVPASISGHPLLMLLDTGSPMTIINRRFVAMKNIEITKMLRNVLYNTANKMKCSIARVNSLRIGLAELGDYPVFIADLTSWSKHEPIDGILGSEVLKGLNAKIDYRLGILTLRDRNIHSKAEQNAVANP